MRRAITKKAKNTEVVKNFLQIIVCSSEGPEKNYPLARALADELGPETQMLIMCNTEASGELEKFNEYVEFKVFPGTSAVDLRALVPTQTASVEWVVLLEDHISVEADWLKQILAELKRIPDDVTCLIGAAANLTSTEKWSWANFLNVQIYHWAPKLIEPLKPLGFNVAYRRKLLPDRTLEPGEFEVASIPELMRKPLGSVNFPANHVQVRYLFNSLFYHFCNGRVSGAAIRDYHPDGFRHVLRHAVYNAGARRREVNQLILTHPKFEELPSGTRFRVSVLAFIHSAGAVFGGVFGPGRAAWALE